MPVAERCFRVVVAVVPVPTASGPPEADATTFNVPLLTMVPPTGCAFVLVTTGRPATVVVVAALVTRIPAARA